jgi:hypothetical protein
MADNATRHFLPWVRQGAASGITTPDSLGSNQPAEIALPIAVQFDTFTVPTKDMRLYGPADVTAIDPRQIVRIQPRHLTTNFESNCFPLIEFDRPDFPWLFTPAKPGADERLRPWICLVVVRKQEGVTLGRVETSPLPVLEIRSPVRVSAELPNLDESWAWAHAQVVGSSSDTLTDVKNVIESAPARTVSRLMAPRRLDPDVAYMACVVPAFDVGRKAGLGLPVTGEDLAQLAPAWLPTTPTTPPFQVPVYFSWEFTTGPEGDFESLARDLQPRPLPKTVGIRPLNVQEPGFNLPSGGVLPMKGILKPPEPADVQPTVVPEPLRKELAKLLNAPANMLPTSASGDPIVAPPIYGSSYPPRDRVVVNNVPPHWINELNLDPRDRVAASFGTRIVQEDQEHLMASAWQQVDAIQKENQERRRRQLAEANRQSTWDRHVSRLNQDGLLQVTGVSLSKVAVVAPEGQRTVAWQISGSEAPGFQSAILRRVARPRGPINRRALTLPVLQMQVQARPMVKLMNALPDVIRKIPPRPTRIPVGTMVTIKKVSDNAGTPQIDQAKVVPAGIPATPIPRGQRPQFFEIKETQGQSRRSIDNNFSAPEPRLIAEFRLAARAHLSKAVRSRVKPIIVRRIPDTATLTNRLKSRLLDVTKVHGPSAAAARSSAENEVLAHPQFPAPMSERLIELAPDFLLPGLDDVPPNTVTLVQPNARFIEAFMVGLNHEMGRELLWREYPTDQRGTYFRFFWNRRGATQQQQPMTPINRWDLPLGRNPSGAGNPDQLVLLVRGELFRRYPTAVIYAAKATGTLTNPKLTPEERYPLFRGSAPPDVTFFGFDLTETAARGTTTDPGWFFVIQQQPGEPNFGLDMPKDINPQPPQVRDWNQLTWRHLVQSAAELRALVHVKVIPKPGEPALPDTTANPPGARWGVNGAHMARITLQKPVRIAILANQMLPPKA